MSGWGKSYHGQAIIEASVPDFNFVVILDYKDEYRGLVKSGYVSHFIVGPKELAWDVDDWRAFLQANPKVTLVRHLSDSDWREVCGRIIQAARDLAGASTPTLVAIDEAHVAAPESGSYPEATANLATTGRGEGASSLWMDQRLAKLDKDVVTQADETIIGGFMRKQDRRQVEAEYPIDIHNPQKTSVPGIPEALQADDDPTAPLRRFTEIGDDGEEHTVGSEWAYANDKGEMARRDTSSLSMESAHYAPEGHAISDPDYS